MDAWPAAISEHRCPVALSEPLSIRSLVLSTAFETQFLVVLYYLSKSENLSVIKFYNFALAY